jgi:hypothetical protein
MFMLTYMSPQKHEHLTYLHLLNPDININTHDQDSCKSLMLRSLFKKNCYRKESWLENSTWRFLEFTTMLTSGNSFPGCSIQWLCISEISREDPFQPNMALLRWAALLQDSSSVWRSTYQSGLLSEAFPPFHILFSYIYLP